MLLVKSDDIFAKKGFDKAKSTKFSDLFMVLSYEHEIMKCKIIAIDLIILAIHIYQQNLNIE